MLHDDGWLLVVTRGSHRQFKNPNKLPGCVATGATIDDVQREMREAIELHIAGMREDGEPIPQPSSSVQYVDIAA